MLLNDEGVKKIIEVNAQIKPNERVLIVGDYLTKDLSMALAISTEKYGAETTICLTREREWDCQEPTFLVAEAMKSADVIFIPVTISIAWTNAVRKAISCGARVLLMTGYTKEVFSSPSLLKTDFKKQKLFCKKLSDVYNSGEIIRLKTDLGTDLTFSKKNRRVNQVTSIPEAGEIGSPPNIEINVSPVENSANGILIVNASIPYLDIGLIKDPIKFIIKDGYIVDIIGNHNATILKNNLSSFKNRNCYNIAEFGIGLNPNATLCGVMLIDEGVLGTIHIGIGTSITLGGKIDAPMHYDLIVDNVNIEIDDVLVQRNCDFLI